MIDTLRVLGFIPARGGSTGLPDKNIRPLNGLPLLSHTVRAARGSGYIDKLVVSTNDARIKSVAIRENVTVIDRPANISGPTASTESAILHTLDVFSGHSERFDLVVILEPTSPFRTAQTIDGAIETLVSGHGDSLIGVRETDEVIGTLSDGFFQPLIPNEPRRRQDRQLKYVEASTIYVCRTEFLRRTETLVCNDWLAYVVPETEAIDINTLEDLKYAEFLITLEADK